MYTILKKAPPRATKAHSVTLTSVSVALSQTPAEAARPRTRVSLSRGLPV